MHACGLCSVDTPFIIKRRKGGHETRTLQEHAITLTSFRVIGPTYFHLYLHLQSLYHVYPSLSPSIIEGAALPSLPFFHYTTTSLTLCLSAFLKLLPTERKRNMAALVAKEPVVPLVSRTGRHLQRYCQMGFRQVVGLVSLNSLFASSFCFSICLLLNSIVQNIYINK